jgi:CHAT domain-containing protein
MTRQAVLTAAMAGVLVGVVWAAAPLAKLTPEQVKLLRDRPLFGPAEKKLEIELRVFGPWHRQVEKTADVLSNAYQARGEWAKEAKYRRMVVDARRAMLGADNWQTVNARLAWEVALAQVKRTPAQREALVRAARLNGQALALHRKGQTSKAIPLAKQALEIHKEALGEKHATYASSLNFLAFLYAEMGEYKAALPLYRQARAIRKEVLGEKHPYYANTLNNLAVLYQSMGEYKAARPLYAQALEIRKQVLGLKHPDCATSLNDLAGLYESMGDYKAALPLYQKALAIRKEVLGEKHPDYAQSLNNLASLYKDMGDHKAALPLSRQARDIYKEALGERHPLYALSLNNLAVLYQAMGDHKTARPLAEEAAVKGLSYLCASATVQSDRQQLAAAEGLRHRLDFRLSLLDVEGYKQALAWKGAILLRQRQRRLFSALSTGPKTRKAAEELQTTSQQIAALSATSRPAREELEGLTRRQEALQAELSGRSAEARAAFKGHALTAQALSSALPEGAVLVDYHSYWRSGIGYRDGKTNWVRHLVAFVSRKGKPTARIDLGPSSEAIDALQRWREALTARESGQAQGAVLHRLIWSPLEKHLVGAKVVLVSPAGPLAAAPFAALPGKKKNTYLIEDVAVAVVPVPQMLPEMLKPLDKAKRLGPSLLLVDDVDYDRAGAAAKVEAGERGAPLGVRRDWGRLAETFAETAAVSKSFSGLFDGGTVTDLSKGKATKARVREALARVRYAHFATHGFFAAEDIKSAATGKAPEGLFGRGGVTGWHPLLLSGIVLAGANREPKEGEEDGILTALEVSELELPKLELVVLSACETGLGKTAGGEGLLGLQRAFAVAGARTVVASLWQVDDRATRALMADFYTAAWDTEKVISRAEALRQAQLKMLKDGAARGGIVKLKPPRGKPTPRLPPYYWAGFVLSGDWR